MFNPGQFKTIYPDRDEEYKSFLPSLVNIPLAWSDKEIGLLLEEAMRYLGELNAYSNIVPDVDFFIKMHVLKEATTSSRIEGTRTDIDDVVLPKSEIKPEKRDDWTEVHNYIAAVNFAISELVNLPLSIRLLKETHAGLMSGVRGEKKYPGEIRKSQNWIGGSSPRDAFFVPPHWDYLPDLLTDLEKFWHNRGLGIPNLIKVAIGHYQFETIHPFCDGNGRLGRLLITLQLVELGFLQKPALYLSAFFEKNKGSYYDSLTMVRTTGNMDQWIKFFLSGVIETAKNGRDTLQAIVRLRKEYNYKILGFGKRINIANNLLLKLFANPAISISAAADSLDVTFTTADRLIKKLTEEKILKEITGQNRNQLFVLNDYLNLFK